MLETLSLPYEKLRKKLFNNSGKIHSQKKKSVTTKSSNFSNIWNF